MANDPSPKRIHQSGMEIAEVLYSFVMDEALPGLPVDPEAFWIGLADIVAEFRPRNQELLEERVQFQRRIDLWHLRQGRTQVDPGEYHRFLKRIGYLEQEGAAFEITTSNVDPEISEVSGPQLVVPVLNARFALNAANARWGSLYDALYGTDVIPESPGREQGTAYNPVRGELVVERATHELDRMIPLRNASHANVNSYVVIPCDKHFRLVAECGSEERQLEVPDQFVGFVGAASRDVEVFLCKHHGLHIEIHVDRTHPIGSSHRAGIKDVVLEAALTTIQDCEDSVAAVDADDKSEVYRNWLGLMNGGLTASFKKSGGVIQRSLAPDRHYRSAIDGSEFSLPGRSLMFVRNVGLLLRCDAVLDREGEQIFEGILDAVLTSLCAMHDLRNKRDFKNSRAGSIYIVKPKLHGSKETRFTCELFDRVEDLLGLERNTIKVGVMDEERRTTVNLRECIRVARERVVFINTGFLDRTGDEIRTSMEAGPVVRKECMKQQPWMLAYEDANVDAGLATGFRGRAQIGKGMWAKPDKMDEMLSAKIDHPQAGANTAWVPSPTAATLHALHYHQVDVLSRQERLASRPRSSLYDILKIPLLAAGTLSAHEVQAELENNIQGILGYVVRWVDQGIGCSRVPDIGGIGLMEDRATCRISSLHIGNWLHHGVVSKRQVIETLQKMTAVVDIQNASDASYRPMSRDLHNNMAFQAATELVLDGISQPNGYTETILYRYRRVVKEHQRS